MQVFFAGTRGAYPTLSPTSQKTGGNTNCVTVSVGDDRLIIDGGTGTENISPRNTDDTIVLSHFHLDHLIGLPMFLTRKQQGGCLIIKAVESTCASTKTILSKIFGSEFFPVSLEVIHPTLDYHDFETQTQIGKWSISAHPLNHPGGSFGYRINHQDSDQTFTHLLDHEHGTQIDEALMEFAHGSSLVAWDGCYESDIYANVKGFGHSTWEEGIKFGNAIGSPVAISGHRFNRTDDECDQIEAKLSEPHLIARDRLLVELPLR
ncbi:MAG: MBL fold metallo-hydrolase [Gammaproteobacteria bacterium]